ncbi:MAG TPA: hypothetical protein VF304_10290 [Casimicrobiaceae bacterium]
MPAFHSLRPLAVLLGLTLSLVSTSGSASTYDALLGTFGLVEQGRMIEVLRIERHGHDLLLYQKHGGQWLAPVVVQPVRKARLETLIKQPIDVPFEGLGNDRLAVLRVPKGWRFGAFECDTGYWLATSLGPAELHKL